MKYTVLILLIAATAVRTASLQDKVREHLNNNMPEATEEESKMITYLPSKNSRRIFRVPKVHFGRIVKSMKILVPVSLTEESYEDILKTGNECENDTIHKKFIQEAGNTIDKEGFNVGEFNIWVDCTAKNDKLEVVIFGNTLRGTYSKVRTQVEKKICETDPITGEEECHTEVVIKEKDREITPEVLETAERVIQSVFFSFNLANL